MPEPMEPGDLAEALEKLIDQHTLATVLWTLAEVCAEKAEHLRTTWQDKATAKVWDKAATAVNRVANNVTV